jgi:hypothetical protein
VTWSGKTYTDDVSQIHHRFSGSDYSIRHRSSGSDSIRHLASAGTIVVFLAKDDGCHMKRSVSVINVISSGEINFQFMSLQSYVKPESFFWYHPDDPICVQSGLILLLF